jgi:hypothetical protein
MFKAVMNHAAQRTKALPQIHSFALNRKKIKNFAPKLQ